MLEKVAGTFYSTTSYAVVHGLEKEKKKRKKNTQHLSVILRGGLGDLMREGPSVYESKSTSRGPGGFDRRVQLTARHVALPHACQPAWQSVPQRASCDSLPVLAPAPAASWLMSWQVFLFGVRRHLARVRMCACLCVYVRRRH